LQNKFPEREIFLLAMHRRYGTLTILPGANGSEQFGLDIGYEGIGFGSASSLLDPGRCVSVLNSPVFRKI
jgi:hypothetical protein